MNHVALFGWSVAALVSGAAVWQRGALVEARAELARERARAAALPGSQTRECLPAPSGTTADGGSPASEPPEAGREAPTDRARAAGATTVEVERYYRPLLEALQLEPSRAVALHRCLAERRMIAVDARAVGAEHSLDLEQGSALRAWVQEAHRAVDNEIRALLTEPEFRRYQAFRQTLPLREVLAEIRRSFEFAGLAPDERRLRQMEDQVARAFEPQ